MALEKLLGMSGVQMMLRQLLATAAPELEKQIEDVAKVVMAFKAQLERIDAQQQRIMARLGISNAEVIDHDDSSRLGNSVGRGDRTGGSARS